MVLFLDLDGTLLNSRHSIGEQDRKTIATIKDNVLVVLTSARKPSAMRIIQKGLGIIDYPLVCYNGALVLNGNLTLYSKPIESKTISLIEDIALRFDTAINYYLFDTWAASKYNSLVQKEAEIVGENPIIVDVRHWGKPAHKILLICEIGVQDTLLDLLSSLNNISVCVSKPSYIEITATDVSKGHAIPFIASMRPSSSTMAIGDGSNDISLFREVTISVAMANAPIQVRDSACFTTLSNDQNGVSFAIKRYYPW